MSIFCTCQKLLYNVNAYLYFLDRYHQEVSNSFLKIRWHFLYCKGIKMKNVMTAVTPRCNTFISTTIATPTHSYSSLHMSTHFFQLMLFSFMWQSISENISSSVVFKGAQSGKFYSIDSCNCGIKWQPKMIQLFNENCNFAEHWRLFRGTHFKIPWFISLYVLMQLLTLSVPS